MNFASVYYMLILQSNENLLIAPESDIGQVDWLINGIIDLFEFKRENFDSEKKMI